MFQVSQETLSGGEWAQGTRGFITVFGLFYM